uniref:Uncharacterized protein n=1 Tax=Megaselia scalaris TaxID=36166 RepID=T1GAH2_MEGSC
MSIKTLKSLAEIPGPTRSTFIRDHLPFGKLYGKTTSELYNTIGKDMVKYFGCREFPKPIPMKSSFGTPDTMKPFSVQKDYGLHAKVSLPWNTSDIKN